VTFEQELTVLINRHSVENGSDTPDFILAAYIEGCLELFARAAKARDGWYGHKTLSTASTESPERDKPAE
jgi:hypothetical protein